MKISEKSLELNVGSELLNLMRGPWGMNTRAGDMIPVSPAPLGALDDLDRWAREQAGLAR